MHIEDLLIKLGLSVPESKIYKELMERGELPANELANILNIPRPSVYDYVKNLKKKNLILEKEIDNKTFFLINNIKDIESLLKNKISEDERLLNDWKSIKNNLNVKKVTKAKIKFFENKAGLQSILDLMLFSKSKIIYSLWPYEEMLEVLGVEALQKNNIARLNRDIKIKVIWPHKFKKAKDNIYNTNDKLVERKFTPKNFNYTMGYIIIDDKVAYISSKDEGYAFVVDSEEHANLIKVNFEALWLNSN